VRGWQPFQAHRQAVVISFRSHSRRACGPRSRRKRGHMLTSDSRCTNRSRSSRCASASSSAYKTRRWPSSPTSYTRRPDQATCNGNSTRQPAPSGLPTMTARGAHTLPSAMARHRRPYGRLSSLRHVTRARRAVTSLAIRLATRAAGSRRFRRCRGHPPLRQSSGMMNQHPGMSSQLRGFICTCRQGPKCMT